MLFSGPCGAGFAGGGDFDVYPGALSGNGLEEELASEQLGPLAHAEEAEVSVLLRFDDALGSEGTAIVANFQEHGAVACMEIDPRVFRPGMFFDILQGLLGEAEKMGQLAVSEETDGFRHDADFKRHASASAESLGVFFQRGGEAKMIENGRTQVAGEVAHVVEGGAELVGQVEKFLPQPCGNFILAGEADASGGGGEDLGNVVVQLATDLLVLLLAQFKKALGESLKFADVVFRVASELRLFAALEDERARLIPVNRCLFPGLIAALAALESRNLPVFLVAFVGFQERGNTSGGFARIIMVAVATVCVDKFFIRA